MCVRGLISNMLEQLEAINSARVNHSWLEDSRFATGIRNIGGETNMREWKKWSWANREHWRLSTPSVSA